MATRACAIFTAMCCLSFVAVSAQAGAQETSSDGVGDSRVFAFGSMDDRGEYIHCVVNVTPDEADAERLIPGNERCFKDERSKEQFVSGGSVDGASVGGAQSTHKTVIGVHFDNVGFEGESLTMTGTHCNRGGVTLKGRWKDRIESTINGCSIIRHYSHSRDGVFSGTIHTTTGLGGDMSTALRNNVEGIIYDGNFRAGVTYVAFEVTQGLQDWNNSIPLVKGKETAVRIFLETAGSARNEVSGILYYRIEGQKKRGPISPINHRSRVIVSSNVRARRYNLSSSLNFIVPANILSATDKNDKRVTFEFVPVGLRPFSCTICTATVTYKHVPGTKIYIAPVRETGKGVSADAPITPEEMRDINEQSSRIRSIMPFSQLTTFEQIHLRETYNIQNTDDLSEVNEDLLGLLAQLKSNKQAPDNSIIFGLISGDRPNPDTSYGVGTISANFAPSDRFDDAAVSFDADIKTELQYGFVRNAASHEIGHIFEQEHPARVVSTGGGENSPASFCGATNHIANQRYPYQRASTAASSGWMPTLGPMNSGTQSEVWGFDTRLAGLDLSGRHFIYGVIRSFLSVVNPKHTASFMSYCNVTSLPSQRLWMDVHHYNRVIAELKRRAATTTTTSTTTSTSSTTTSIAPIPTTTTTPVLYISGTLQTHPITSENPIDFVADFNRVYSSQRLSVNPPPRNSRFHLELRDDAGNLVVSTPVWLWSGQNLGHSDTPDTSSRLYFNVEIPNPPEYHSIAIVEYGDNSNAVSGTDGSATKQIAEVVKSDNAPTVSISSPRLEQSFAGDKVEVSWGGSDLDGDSLTYRVFYSADGGASYRIVALDTTETSLTIHRSLLPGSDEARFKVSVSDGISSTYTESDIFSVESNPPSVQIMTPGHNSVFTDWQAFALKVLGNDIEDRNLSSEAYEWSSNIDGVLGIGKSLLLSAADLTPGWHAITLTLTDTSGMTATAARNIQIKRFSEIPEAVPDTAVVNLNETRHINVLANDIDQEGDVDFSLFEITEAPKLGEAKIELTPEFIWSIKYSGNERGRDSLKYQICDGIDRCSEATLTIDVGLSECTILGTDDADTLSGTSGNDVICGLGGDDVIRGRGGNDIIWGGEGDDTLYGGPGDDTIHGEIGEDIISGNRGSDKLFGGEDSDTIYGNTGNNLIYGGSGSDTIYGGNGNDVIEGNEENDEINGGHGDDTIRGGEGEDDLRGSIGNDKIFGGDGADLLNGGDGDDTIYGGEGTDTLVGGNGNDSLHGGTGSDILYGNDGDDTIKGNEGDDQIRGGDGHDTLNGGQGSDTIRGNAGTDTIENAEEQDLILGEDDTSDSLASG